MEFSCSPIKQRRQDPSQITSRHPRRKRFKPNRNEFVAFEYISALAVLIGMCGAAGIPAGECPGNGSW